MGAIKKTSSADILPMKDETLYETELSRQLKQKRAQQGISQDELAEAIYVSRQTISNWETGKTYPDVQSLLLLSKTFDVSIDELIQGDVVGMRAAMRDDARKMEWLTWVLILSAALGIVFFVGLSAVWSDPSSVGALSKGILAGLAVFVPLYALSMGAAIAIERIKKRHDIVTYREIAAFSQEDDEAFDRDAEAFSRTHPVISMMAKVLLGTTAGAFIGVLAYKLFG